MLYGIDKCPMFDFIQWSFYSYICCSQSKPPEPCSLHCLGNHMTDESFPKREIHYDTTVRDWNHFSAIFIGWTMISGSVP